MGRCDVWLFVHTIYVDLYRIGGGYEVTCMCRGGGVVAYMNLTHERVTGLRNSKCFHGWKSSRMRGYNATH